MSLSRFQPLSEAYFRAGVTAMLSTLARFRPNAEDSRGIHESWLRIVFPACQGREHWQLALDRLMVEFKDMPKPADALEILAQIEASSLGPERHDLKPIPPCERPESDHTSVEWWIHNNPKREDEGSLAYIDRIAVGSGLIPASRLK